MIYIIYVYRVKTSDKITTILLLAIYCWRGCPNNRYTLGQNLMFEEKLPANTQRVEPMFA